MSLKLTDFEIIKDLGAGSFGSVKLVKKKDNSQILAMKAVSLSKLTPKQKDNALNQIRLLASIQIPNVIAYKASLFDQQSSSLCIFMQYADGGDLQSKVQELRRESHFGFEERYVWKVCYQILQGLKKLHIHKIIHRDIKSGNIFFVDGIAKLGDLNVSKVAEKGFCETQTGTLYYTSPQIWSGKRYGNKCDIWSLGVLLYQMCTLNMPFKGKDFPTLYRNVIECKYDDINEIYSVQMRNLIRMCLIVEEEMRPSASELLQTAILRGMEMSLDSFNAQQGQIKLIDPIKCPRVLRFLAVKLPKSRFQQEKKVNINKLTKKEKEQTSFKIKSVKKIKSEKNIHFEEKQDMNSMQINSKIKKNPSRKHINLIEQNQQKPDLQKLGSKKTIKLPALQTEAKVLVANVVLNHQQKRSIKQIGSSKKVQY